MMTSTSNVGPSSSPAISSYAYFLREIHSKEMNRLKDHPEEKYDFSGFHKMVKEMWDSMTDEERNKYSDIAKEDTKRPKNKRILVPEEEERSDKDEAPKSSRGFSLSSYAYFIKEMKDKETKDNPEKKLEFSSFSKKCAEIWKNMNDGEKKKYSELAKEDAERIKGELANQDEDEGEKEVSLAGWEYFREQEREKPENKGLSFMQVSKHCADLWNGLSKSEKDRYDALAAKHWASLRQQKKVKT